MAELSKFVLDVASWWNSEM